MFRLSSFKTFTAVASMAVFLPFAALAHDWSEREGPAFHQVVVFGDSLSDPGNVFAVTGQYSVRPFAPIPSAPYVIGGMHFTNGATWVERLSRELHTPSGAGPALRAPQIFTNYAFGGARARAGGPSASPGLGSQVGMYFANSGPVVDAGSLYVVWFGSNDVRDALEALGADQTGATTSLIMQGAIGAIRDNVVALWAAGARTFLVPNVPDLAITPAVAAQPAPIPGLAHQFSAAYNAGLAQLLAGLEAQLPGVRIVRLDIFAMLNGIVAAPSAYGIANATEPCLRFGVLVNAVCDEPRKYLFWDAVHPTAAVHKILAERAESVLGF